MSFEENLKKLEEIVRELESGNIPLDESIPKFNEAMEIAKKCSETLKNAEENINKIVTVDGKLENYEIKE